MNMIQQKQTIPGEVQRRPNRIIGFILHFLLPIAALACGIAITVYLMKTSPEAKPGKRPPTATLVEVQKAMVMPQQAIISGMGEIVPAREIELKPRVSGEIIQLSEEFIPGGYFLAGEKILKIDPVDYTLVLLQLESEAAKAESDLSLEMGNQRIAEKELAILNESVSPVEKALILRKPQLDKLQASKDFAEAKLSQARLNLQRTEIEAPFNSVINSRNVNLGTRVTESTVLAHLVGTDSFWLRLTLPVDQLQWVNIPTTNDEEGSTVRIYSQQGNDATSFRTGKVIRLAASLEEQGRMAQLLVSVDDPLCRKEENRGKPQLLLGSYVRAEIEGKTIENGITIDRANIHDGSHIWLMDKDGSLEIRPIEITFRNREKVIVKDGISAGERIITSALASPIAGIPLRLEGQDEKGSVKGLENPGQGKGRPERAE
jgi:RND family efflux transporter MFP subunit